MKKAKFTSWVRKDDRKELALRLIIQKAGNKMETWPRFQGEYTQAKHAFKTDKEYMKFCRVAAELFGILHDEPLTGEALDMQLGNPFKAPDRKRLDCTNGSEMVITWNLAAYKLGLFDLNWILRVFRGLLEGDQSRDLDDYEYSKCDVVSFLIEITDYLKRNPEMRKKLKPIFELALSL